MKVLLSWELGKNFGHVAKLITLGRSFAEKGAEVVFALQNPGALHNFKIDYDYTVVQAPFAPIRPMKGPVLTYTDDLRPCGYMDAKTLAGLMQSWRGLYKLVKPKFIVIQSGPTPILAARGQDIPVIDLGTGYELPPLTTPFPSTSYWNKVDEKTLAKREDEILKNINDAYKLIGEKPIKSFAAGLSHAHRMLSAFEELDHYQEREETTEYFGGLYKVTDGANLKWRKDAEKRVFAYIRPNAKSFKATFEALVNLPEDFDVIIAAPGIPKNLKEKFESDRIGIEDGPVRLDKILPKCDLVMCHAGIGMCTAALMKGVPLLMLPSQIEQHMFARAVGRLGAGRGVIGQFGPKKIFELTKMLLNEPQFKEAALDFAKKYKGHTPEKASDEMVSHILDVIKGKKKKPAPKKKTAKKK